jgi:type I restriction enzyme S subunit
MDFTNKKEVKTIDEVTEKIIDYRGKSPKKTLSGVRLVTAKSVKNGRIEDDYFEYIAEEDYDTWMTRGLPKKDDILFTTEAPLGQVAQLTTDQKIALAQRIVILRGEPNQIDQKYYLYALQSRFVQNQLQNQATGGTAKGISQKRLRKINLITFPIKEQKKIAEILSHCDRAIELTQKLIASKQKLKQGLMQQLLVGKLRFPEFKTFQPRQKLYFMEVPSDWKCYSIGEICQEVTERNAPPDTKVLSCTKYDGLVPSLEYFNRRVYGKNLDQYKVIKKNQIAYATNHIEEGSIGLLEKLDIGLVSPLYTVFRIKNDLVLPQFLIRLLKTESYRQIFEAFTHSSVNRRGSLRWSGFQKIKVAIPELEEQKKIVNTFKQIENEISCYEQKMMLYQQTKKGLMQQLLTGKTRVPLNQ